ncbi:MAG: hypothetical protein GXY67_07780 [Clostridiales bacterium]|nr:hypothetical protein [Clostridiales bacterium]
MRFLIHNGLEIWAIFCGILVLNGIYQVFKLAAKHKGKAGLQRKAPAVPAAKVALVQHVQAQPTEKHASRKRGRPPKAREAEGAKDGTLTLGQFAERVQR